MENTSVADARLFREFLRNPATVGCICASSARLGDRMARHVDLGHQGSIVELGGGTGALTSALLRNGVPEGRLIVIEKSAALSGYLSRRFPRIRIVRGDAAYVDMLLDADETVTSIVSGLPLCSLPQVTVERITRACAARLAPEGRIVQFSYVWRRASPWLDAGMKKLRAEIEWINIPPAQVEVLDKARGAS